MKVKVAKWGNSLGVRLPKAAVESAGVTAGSELDLAKIRPLDRAQWAGAIDNLIPPSIGFILYGIASDTSIVKLFAAGAIWWTRRALRRRLPRKD